GVIKVVVKKNFVAVGAQQEWQAIEAGSGVEGRGNVAPRPSYDTFLGELQALSPTANRGLSGAGAGGPALRKRGETLPATYDYPLQMHGSMGASAGTASVEGKTATVWSSTQGVYQLRSAIATALGIPAQNVHVLYVEGSGCYGLNGADNVALDAAVISQAVGRPVPVQY